MQSHPNHNETRFLKSMLVFHYVLNDAAVSKLQRYLHLGVLHDLKSKKNKRTW
jgi:hypothetical protein